MQLQRMDLTFVLSIRDYGGQSTFATTFAFGYGGQRRLRWIRGEIAQMVRAHDS
jgi:hypothetical protein